MPAASNSYKPGQNLFCTIEKLPRNDDQTATLARLMRLDPENKRGLRRAQRMRKQRLIVYNRGNRDWVSRERTAKVVHVGVGENFTLPFSHDLVHDIARIQQFIKITLK